MRKILIALIILACAATVKAVEIQLDQVQNKEEKPGMNVGYVDVGELFEEHPMTARLKEEFLKEADKRKQAEKDFHSKITAMEGVVVSSTTEIKQLKQEIENLRKNQTQVLTVPQSQGAVLSSSTSAAPEVAVKSSAPAQMTIANPEQEIKDKLVLISDKEKGIEALKNEIEKSKAALSELRKKDKKELEALENKQSETVMADLYQVIEEVAKEEDLTVIMDKNNILYGKSAKNVTDKVRQRLRGR